jgi:hypothetical protein
VIGRLTDGIARGIESLASGLSGALFDETLRLGVTGLARSGKTVFIASLVANLLDRGRMPQLLGQREGAIRAAWLAPQPDDTVPRFDYETHLAAMAGPEPRWPDSTRSISELRLSFRIQRAGILGALGGPRILHLDIVDYPGEWLLDLTLLEKNYEAWSAEVLSRIEKRPEAAGFLAVLGRADPQAGFQEPEAKALAEAYAAYLHAARGAGYSDCTPGRFLLPGDLAGSPALTFAPLPAPSSRAGRGSLHRAFARRYDAYRRDVAAPFFRDHFAKIDRQVVLMDVLGAVHAGPQAMEDMRRAMAEILTAFRPGRTGVLSRLLGLKRVERLLFAATKIDHLHHTQHARLTAILEAMLREAKDRADFAGARTGAIALAALRATVEETAPYAGEALAMVRGRLAPDGREAAMYPGELPDDPTVLLAPARQGAGAWLGRDYAVMSFLPAKITRLPGEGPPHIRLDRAAEFLIGDKLR